MQTLDERLKSFQKWPLQSPTADELAHHGFYYDPTSKSADRVACHLCSVAVFNWKPSDTPLDRHRQAYCECPLVTIYSNQSYPLKHEVRQARKNTFGKWWPHSKPFAAMPYKLAQAGFVFSPTNELHDQVECLYCHAKVANWSKDDEPLVQHKKLSPECPFILEYYGDAKMVKSASQESLSGVYSPKKRDSKLDVNYKPAKRADTTLQVTETDEVPPPVKRGPGRPRKNPIPIVSLRNQVKSASVEEEQYIPVKKRKFVEQPKEVVEPVQSDHISDVLTKFKSISKEFETKLQQLSLPPGQVQHIDSGIVDQLSEQKSRLEEKVVSQQKELSELKQQLRDRKDEGFASQVQHLKRDLKDAIDEISVIKKENVKLKSTTSQSHTRTVGVRLAALQTLPAASRRVWYQDEIAIFEGRLGLDKDTYVQSLVEVKPAPFLNCIDIPWPVPPVMYSIQQVTLPMITSFLMSDLSKTEFDGFCQWLMSKFSEESVGQWMQFIKEIERPQVLQKSRDIWQCLNEAKSL